MARPIPPPGWGCTRRGAGLATLRALCLAAATVLISAATSKGCVRWRMGSGQRWDRRRRLLPLLGLRLRGGHRAGCACGEAGEASAQSLYDLIAVDACSGLNTQPAHGVEAVLRPRCERDDPTRMLISSDDDQVLLFISFTEFVNLKAITLTGRGDTRVKELRAFSSHLKRPISDFEEAEDALPHASWLLPLSDASATTSGEITVNIPGHAIRHFQQIKALTLFVRASHGAEVTVIGWLGLTGERTHTRLRQVVENAEYELRPKNELGARGFSQGGAFGF